VRPGPDSLGTMSSRQPHVLIVGGGYVGLYTALSLRRHARRARVTVVDPQPHMTYQPFLPEAAAGSIEPRHVVVPLRKVLRHAEVITGRVTGIEHARRTARIQPSMGPAYELRYDQVVVAPGSISRTLPVPGLREQGIGFKTIGERPVVHAASTFRSTTRSTSRVSGNRSTQNRLIAHMEAM